MRAPPPDTHHSKWFFAGREPTGASTQFEMQGFITTLTQSFFKYPRSVRPVGKHGCTTAAWCIGDFHALHALSPRVPCMVNPNLEAVRNNIETRWWEGWSFMQEIPSQIDVDRMGGSSFQQIKVAMNDMLALHAQYAYNLGTKLLQSVSRVIGERAHLFACRNAQAPSACG